MENIKMNVIRSLEEKAERFRKVSAIRYRMRCPFCGDSVDPDKSHMYLLCDDNPNTPILYYCFKGNCNAKGKVDSAFLQRLGITVDGVDTLANRVYNKVSSMKTMDVDLIGGTPNMNSPQVKYVHERLGEGFTYEDFERFKIVWDFSLLSKYITSERTKNLLPSNRDSISFIMDDRSLIMTRFFHEEEKRWRKYDIYPSEDKHLYTIKSVIDIFTSETITVHIAEGIFDILSIYKNFSGQNDVYIACLGADYESGITYAVQHGILGKNVSIRIYLDGNIKLSIMRKRCRKYAWLFKEILFFENAKSNDFGTTPDRIEPIEHRL